MTRTEHRGGYQSAWTPASKLVPPPTGVAPGVRQRVVHVEDDESDEDPAER